MKMFDVLWKVSSLIVSMIVVVFYLGKNQSNIESSLHSNTEAIIEIKKGLSANSVEIKKGNEKIVEILYENREKIHNIDKKVTANERDLLHLLK